MQFPVGILRPNWLENATYLRTETVDLYNCNVWTKADGFITYWEDVIAFPRKHPDSAIQCTCTTGIHLVYVRSRVNLTHFVLG